jgi:VIT1/CCC1 family predicted Fe2+/Mn2+ transporter
MVLTCTLGASVIAGFDHETLRRLLIAALGCNFAWGVIDAALYVMGNVFARSHNRRLMQAIRSAPDDSAALAIVRRTLEPRVGPYGRDEDRERLYRSLHGVIARTDALEVGITADDLRGAIAVFVLVVGSALPPAIPFFLIGDPLVALRISNLVLVALLFVVGFYWSRAIGGGGWGAGLLLMLSGVVLVGVAIAFGG